VTRVSYCRERYRDDLRDCLRRAADLLRIAEQEGRRADCLRVAADGLRGALRNVCSEDADALKDPTIVFVEPGE